MYLTYGRNRIAMCITDSSNIARIAHNESSFGKGRTTCKDSLILVSRKPASYKRTRYGANLQRPYRVHSHSNQ